jgi:mannosyltransferase
LAGVLTGYGNNQQQRTQAVQVAAVLNLQAQPGDEVIYCPDQLGPAVNRLLTVPGVTQLTFPRAIGPDRVDWVNYKQVIDRTDVATFAQQMLAQLPAGRTLWLVYRNGYPGFGGDCGDLNVWLNFLRPSGETVVSANGRFFEYENLVRFPN